MSDSEVDVGVNETKEELKVGSVQVKEDSIELQASAVTKTGDRAGETLDRTEEKVDNLGETKERTDILDGTRDKTVSGVTRSSQRQQIFTERGRGLQLAQLNRRFRATISGWRRYAGIIEKRISDTEDIQILKKDLDTLGECMEDLDTVYQSIADLSYDSVPDDQIEQKYEIMEAEHHSLIKRVSQRISEIKAETRSSRTTSSRRSNRSDRSMKMDAAAKAAELKAKLRFIEEEAIQKTHLEKLQTTKELAMAEAKLEAIVKIEQESLEFMDLPNETRPPTEAVKEFLNSTQPPVGDELLNRIPQSLPASPLKSPENIPGPEWIDSRQHQSTSIDTLVELLKISRLPTPEPGLFNGEPLHYISWKNAFQSLISSRGIPEIERLYYLKKYLGGEARSCVEGFFMLDSQNAFSEAFQLLDERFGDPFLVADQFRNKLDSWPKITSKDSKGLVKLSDFLKQCKAAMKSIDSLAILNDERENRNILQKLPEWLVTRWGRVVFDHKEKLKRFPSFEKFVEFINREARIANELVTSTVNKVSDRVYSPGTKARVLDTSTSEHIDKYVQKETKSYWKNGPGKEIKPWKNNRERTQHFMKNGLCFECEQHGHLCRDCPNKNRNNSQTQMSLPHTPTLTEKRTTNMRIARNCSAGKSSMTVPVYISSMKDPDNEFLVYALLDTQSDTTFILDKVSDMIDTQSESTSLEITTMNTTSNVTSRRFSNLQIRGMYQTKAFPLPTTYSTTLLPSNRHHIPTADVASKWPHLQTVQIPPLLNCRVGLLIGYDCPRAFAPVEVIQGSDDEPFAMKTILGWSIFGNTLSADEDKDDDTEDNIGTVVCRTGVREDTIPQILKILESDFQEKKSEKTMSQDDLKFMEILRQGIHKDDENFYEMPLPFRYGKPQLPDNRHSTMKRLLQLKKKLKNDSGYYSEYCTFMSDMITRGDVEEVPVEEIQTSQCVWYIPHHGVYHKKKQKLRIVFDCSSKYQGTCLNDHLLQGPDLLNSLLGCLIRFREKQVALAADIEKMFYRFRVNPEDRTYLRFLWWRGGDLDCEPTVYQMKVHLFGASSSPGCSNFALKKLAADHQEQLSSNVYRFISREFYVDDGLMSLSTAEEAIHLVKEARELCEKGNIRLHKFISNSKEVMMSIPESERVADLCPVNLQGDTLPSRVLGIQWNVESDLLQFRLKLDLKPMTRRGILSTVASVYDPLGCLSPFILLGKQILQDMCRENKGWDEPLSAELRPRWERWISELPQLTNIDIPRCYLPGDFGEVVWIELHHFSDASSTGYGQCSYLRMMNTNNEINCCLVMAKSRVIPLKPVTIPRMELAAAVISVRISDILNEEMTYQIQKEYFWTDSKIVLAYLRNDERRFHVYVANRIRQIKSLSEVDQWQYVRSSNNPADHASRGLLPLDLINSNWFRGPDFLWEQELPIQDSIEVEIPLKDPKVKRIVVNVVNTEKERTILNRLEQFSDWKRLVMAVSVIKKFLLKTEVLSQQTIRQQSELVILRLLQADAFSIEMTLLEGEGLPKRNRLYRLDPFLDQDGLLRVGGRLQHSLSPYEVKHPVILPRKGHIVELIIRHCHTSVAHQGRGFTINELRSQGYWVLGCSKAVSSMIYKCVTCRKLRGKPQEQKMADLPKDRLEAAPPFSYCGIDCFGPFLVKDGRRQMKRYGLLVTCMASRAVHIELLDDMTTDCFINALRCVIALRGQIRLIRCDRGTNFVGAARVLQEALQEIKEDEVRRFLSENLCDFVMNTPHSSHMGGSWERHIRTIRSILATIMDQHGSRIDTATLRTFMYETMAIINNRPLSPQNLNDPLGPEPLTPNHLIMMKHKPLLPLPGKFVKEDVYARHRWRKVQFLTDEFWRRWKSEYMLTLQNRNKWNKVKRNVAVGDIVILKDEETYRGDWRIARVQSTITDDDGLVRRVTLVMGDSNLTRHGKRVSKQVILERPIHKLIMLVENQV
ncbi:MAG: hypothetical protein DRN30_02085 [Thermoplasmata archaeon]|nr:MAG: hypothetical protein DRN30_02085 [Thermoplasmata archaeon]